MKYQKIYLIGTGAILFGIAKYFLKSKIPFCVIVYEESAFSSTTSFCNRAKIDFLDFKDNKIGLENFLNTLNGEAPTLIISANNNYIFDLDFINFKNIDIINFHNSLLPNYKGRNAPMWCIYEGEKTTGITWHIVDGFIDNGDVLTQIVVPLSIGIDALALSAQLMREGLRGFLYIIDDVLALGVRGCKTIKIKKSKTRIYKSFEIPNNGVLDLQNLKNFMRSVAMLDPSLISIDINGEKYVIDEVALIDKAKDLSIIKDGYKIKLKPKISTGGGAYSSLLAIRKIAKVVA